jgi:transposase
MEKLDIRKLTPEAAEAIKRQTARLIEQGYTNPKIVEMTGICYSTVSRIRSAYTKGGVKSLKQKKRGRKPDDHMLLSKTQQSEIRKTIIDKTPDQIKLAYSLWTRQAICEYIKRKYGINVSLRSMTDYLKRWGLTCQRPTKRAYSQDDVRVRDFMEKEYPAIAKRAKAENAEIYWGDEVGVSNQENFQRGFAPKGQPPTIKYDTVRERLNMLSAITNQGTVRFMVFDETLTQQRFIDFMRRLVNDSSRKVFFIVDNLKVHHGKIVKKWLDKHKKRIELFFLPPYAPEYNPDEYLNNALKHDVHSGVNPRSKADIHTKVHSFMRRLQHDTDKGKAFFRHPKLNYILCCV